MRASANRVVDDPDGRLLWEALGGAEPLGSYGLDVAKCHGRTARTAHIEVRAKRVRLQVLVPRKKSEKGVKRKNGKRRQWVALSAVLAREVGTAPPGEEPIEWLLLTNRDVDSFETAKQVIDGYRYRWRVEEFHRTWKTTCRVEDTQLRSAEAIERWAVTLAVVAMRIQRLMQLGRTQPELPATEELTQDEVDALVLHRKPKEFGKDNKLTIGQAVLMIAHMGGYTGKSSGGPPGAQTLGRGLQRLLMAARTIAAIDKVRSDQ